MTYVGRPIRRREDERILRGEGRYLDDISLPGTAHIAFVRSPLAHARIRGIRMPAGALLVLTAADLDAQPLPSQGPEGAWIADAPHPVLARDEVRYAGQPVAVVGLSDEGSHMLHLETYDDAVNVDAIRAGKMRWRKGQSAPKYILDPTRYLVRAQRVRYEQLA